jgi:hypothetical protein
VADATAAIRFALSQLGKPYLWGGNGPNSYDCSGLMVAAYATVGKSLPRTTEAMIADNALMTVNKGQLMPGDLVFPNSGHVQMYLGGGKVVEAPRTGMNIRVTTLGDVMTAKRVTTPSSADWSGTPVSGTVPVSDVTNAGLGDIAGGLLGLGASEISEAVGKGMTTTLKNLLAPLMEILKLAGLTAGGGILIAGGIVLLFMHLADS